MTDRFPGDDATSNALLDAGAERLGDPPPGAAPEPPSTQEQDTRRFNQRANDLLSALDVVQDTGIVMLPELTRAAGKPITVKLKRLTVHELLASDLVPQRAMQIAGYMIEQAEVRVKAIRKRWNLPDDVSPTPEQWAADKWAEEDILQGAMNYIGGSEKDARTQATAGMFSFLGAVCCAAMMDPRAYFDQDQLKAAQDRGLDGVVIWRIPEPDLWLIFNWALSTEARAVRQVDPFPQAVNAPATMGRRQGAGVSGSDPNDV